MNIDFHNVTKEQIAACVFSRWHPASHFKYFQMHILKIFKSGTVKSSQNVRSIVSGLLTYCGTITLSMYGGVTIITKRV